MNGYEIAQKDVKRFGALHALEKLTVLDGQFAEEYKQGLAELPETKDLTRFH
jgi:hypothetical protein